MLEFKSIARTRDDLIGVGQKLGQFIQKAARKSPVLIALEGDENSGKSLIALGVDTVFNPAFYKHGISLHCCADDLMAGKVQFWNFGKTVIFRKPDLDSMLQEFEERSQGAAVCVVSNSMYYCMEDPRTAPLDKLSDRLDLCIVFNSLPTTEKELTFKAREEAILDVARTCGTAPISSAKSSVLLQPA